MGKLQVVLDGTDSVTATFNVNGDMGSFNSLFSATFHALDGCSALQADLTCVHTSAKFSIGDSAMEEAEAKRQEEEKNRSCRIRIQVSSDKQNITLAALASTDLRPFGTFDNISSKILQLICD